MSCGCTDPCQPNSIPCTCEARVTSDCVTVSGATSNCLAIDDNLLLTDYLTQMDERICEKVDSVTNFIALENVGTGSELYKGDSLLGKKQIRTVKSIDPNLVITETADEIQLDLNIPTSDGTDTKLVNGINTTVVGNGSTATPYSVNITFPTPPDGSETKINAGANVTITGNGTASAPYVINSTSGASVNDATSSVKGILRLTGDLGGTADAPTTPTALHITNAETFSGFKSATNTSVTPAGIILTNSNGTFSPVLSVTTNNTSEPGATFITNSIGAAQSINMSGNNINAVGVDILSATTGNINSFPIRYTNGVSGVYSYLKKDGEFMANSFKNRLDSFLVSSTGNVTANSYIRTLGTSTQMLMADGSVKENQDNLQKIITTSTVILDIDNNNTIFINNGVTPITITINSSITLPNFCVGFIQEGTGDVTFVGSGVFLTNPVGLKSKGQGYATFIERKLNTSNYFLLGDTKA